MKKRKTAFVLLSIAGLVTTLSFVIANTMQHHTGKKEALQTNQDIVAKVTPAPTPTPIPTKLPAPRPSVSPTPSLTPTPSPSPAPASMILPAGGAEIIGEYTEDVLVFHETYGDYRAHTGIDFAGDKNAPVSAVLDGIITKNYYDYEEGYVIEIEHDNQLKSIYKNLSTDKMAQVGQVVKQGDVIGGMGDSGIFESHLPYHLHFELTENEETVNPREYFTVSLSEKE